MLERTIISFKCHLIWNQPLLNTLHICCPGQNNLYASSFSLKTSIYSRCILYKLNHSYIQGKHTSGTQIWVWSSLGKKLWNNKNSVSKYIRGLPTKNILDGSYEFFWVFLNVEVIYERESQLCIPWGLWWSWAYLCWTLYFCRNSCKVNYTVQEAFRVKSSQDTRSKECISKLGTPTLSLCIRHYLYLSPDLTPHIAFSLLKNL